VLTSTRFVVLDVETTGLSPQVGHRIIEIGAVCLENGIETCAFHSLINCGCKIPPAAQRVHGICEAMLCNQPPPTSVYPEFHRFIKGAVLIAHNARFDISFLRNEFDRQQLPLINDSRCTLELSRRCLPGLPNYRLQTVARHLLGILPLQGRLHRALVDARLAARVWSVLCERFIIEATRPRYR
jgi:DNA polymerase-3 subunit epsilon